jgi:carboxylate-amine ligase
VHVGCPDAPSAVAAYRGLRNDLPLLRALTAGSPFWHGQDSGLTSARWAVISSYPRSGTPPVATSWDHYLDISRAVAAAAEVPDYSHLWWAARIQPRLGTVEVRVMDPQPSVARIVGLTALIQALGRAAVESPVTVDLPGEVLAENDFRVARHGLDTKIVDTDGVMRPVHELAARRLEDARTILRDAGQDAALDGVCRILHSETEYARQRRLHATGGMSAVVADLAERTMRAR